MARPVLAELPAGAVTFAVIELSGVSVLDVLGRLGAGARPSAQGSAGGAPPPPVIAAPPVNGGVSANGHGEPVAVPPPLVGAGALGRGPGGASAVGPPPGA